LGTSAFLHPAADNNPAPNTATENRNTIFLARMVSEFL
jgi:hypothetical protein